MEISNLFSVKNKVAVVTGGSRGIGEMITAGFLANGAKVYITARKAPALIEKAKELSEKYDAECIAFPCDLSTMEGIDSLVSLIAEKEEGIDKVVPLINERNTLTKPEVQVHRQLPENL